MISIIAVLGFSKSGKTSIIEHVISNLTKQGYRIGTIKHVHNPHHSLDVKGKDSWKHSRAGAKIVICSSPKEIAIFQKRNTHSENIEEIIGLVENKDLDLLLIEGFRSQVRNRLDIQKIVIVRNEEELNNALRETLSPILAFLGPSSLRKELPKDLTTPFLDLREDRHKLIHIIRGFLS